MKRRPVDRKVNYASFVKINMPPLVAGTASRRAAYRHLLPIKTLRRLNKTLDNALIGIIIIFTYASLSVGDAGKRFQTRILAGTRNFKPPAPRSYRSAVCQGQLFRSQRSRPGQVRDAAPRAERGPLGDWHRDGFRLFPALVLSSAGSLRGGWARRPGSPQTRPQAGAQADRRGLGFHRPDTPERAVGADTGTGALDPTAFRDQSTSSKHRTRPAASSKKTPLNESAGQPRAHPDLTKQYEQLR